MREGGPPDARPADSSSVSSRSPLGDRGAETAHNPTAEETRAGARRPLPSAAARGPGFGQGRGAAGSGACASAGAPRD